ncbi:hypothetical protein AAVH_02483 [Aphelenchoides avenae]|nr:hypothetical protein AAVH_02483 [Aphelenchus avenae]
MIDFGWALVCAFFYAIFGLIALSVLVKGIDTLKYPEVSLAGNYAIALLTVLFSAAACFSFVAFIVYVARGIPDEDLRQLSRVFIDGNRVSFVDEIDDETGIIMVNVNEYTPINS